ncbi:UvrD-helicase domain-containing protein [Geofilum sp. OHC36d9]|uniref:UvrD-helicase domain-containing protein n=1 Tax=Geofilum sp. OHC36d9 TaxID=3458413 RepID=UPI004034EA1F
MSQLKIFRASAGSGKTFTLTGEYIRLLFKDPANYRHTLAVTFTNKATAEMRSRILRTLYALSDAKTKNPDYLSDLKKEFNLSDKSIRSTAGSLLRLLLHDYSRFSISTIDSFFQKVTRSFAREMGLPIGFRLELEAEQIMQQAIDQLIQEMDLPQHKELRKWLIQFARERIEDNKTWNIAGEIKNIGQEIIKENFQANAGTISQQINDRNYLSVYKKALEEIIQNIDKQFINIGQKALKIIADYGLNIETDFKNKGRSPVMVFKKMTELKDHMKRDRYLKIVENIDNIITKTAPDEIRRAIEAAYSGGLHDLAQSAIDLLNAKEKDYNTALLILPNLNALGMINDVNEKMMELCRAQNVFLISGTNYLLTRIIDNNETPFIYEKTGTRYSNYMMDEFQDTSTLQYLNFIPLVNDSLATGSYSLMVGDVKQAIYRWRNSDWNLLAEDVESDFNRYGIDIKTLDTNWRSAKEVIRFNNLFFKLSAEAMQTQFNGLIPGDTEPSLTVKKLQNKITNAYSDVFQKAAEKATLNGGEIEIKFLEGENKEDFFEAALPKAIQRISELVQQGFRLSDIAVLVRNNREAVLITNALLSGDYSENNEHFPVISNESLVISNSEAIKLIVAQLKLILRPDDAVLESFVRLHILKYQSSINTPLDASNAFNNSDIETTWDLYKQKLFSHQQKPLYELIENISLLLPAGLYEQHSVYLQGFMSLALSYINQETSDLNQFLNYWDQKGAKISLTVPDNQEAIRVMTIHKSKGLEFEAVVIPFASWTMNHLSHTDLLWLKPAQAPFNAVAMVPVKGVSAMTRSHFADDYFRETLLQYVDNLNVTYVAFTRACQSLSIIAHLKNEDYKKIDTIAHLLHFVVTQPTVLEQYPQGWDATQMTFKVSGVIQFKATKEETHLRALTQTTPPPMKRIPAGTRITNHLESYRSFEDSTQHQQLNYGKIMHQLFELIKTEKDIDPALLQLRLQGKISGNEIPELKKGIFERIHHPKAAHWFDNTYQVKNEATILSKEVKRPDRVMLNNNEVIVIDYKFGHQRSPKHHNQVLQYMQLIQKIESKKVNGFIWYMEKNEIVEVNTQGSLF